MKDTIWMVRAGEGGYIASEFLEHGVVALGWFELGDLSRFADKSFLLEAYRRVWPTAPPGRAMNSASQLWRFREELSIGDTVATYDSSTRTYHIGTIESDYQYRPELIQAYPNARKVAWQAKVDRDVLSVPTRNTLGSTLTLFQVSPEATAEIFEQIRVGPAPADVPGSGVRGIF